MTNHLQRRALLGAALALPAIAARAQGSDWPSRPVRMIVPFPPGQAADLFARVVAEFWADGPASETPPGHWAVLATDMKPRRPT